MVRAEWPRLSGVVEVDETLVGGVTRGAKVGRGGASQVPVRIAVESLSPAVSAVGAAGCDGAVRGPGGATGVAGERWPLVTYQRGPFRSRTGQPQEVHLPDVRVALRQRHPFREPSATLGANQPGQTPAGSGGSHSLKVGRRGSSQASAPRPCARLSEPPLSRDTPVGPRGLQPSAAVPEAAMTLCGAPLRFNLELAGELVQRFPPQQPQDRVLIGLLADRPGLERRSSTAPNGASARA
jgi:hypothetical protein